MEQENAELERLMLKKLRDTLSSEEQEKWEEIRKKDPKFVEDVERVWNDAGSLQLKKGLRPDVRWVRLEDRIQQNASSGMHVPQSKRKLWYFAAAATALIFFAIYLLKPASQIQVFTAESGTRTLALPDNSIVTLNKGATVRYDPDDWGRERTIHLTGEAFFTVARNSVPFTVTSGNAKVSVLGTTFNVRTDGKVTAVACLTGKVAVSSIKDGNKKAVLTKGLGATVDGSSLSEVYNMPTVNETSWMTGNLVFDNTPLPDVFKDLERHFGKKIVVKGKSAAQAFTGKFVNPELKVAVETVCLSTGLTCTFAGDSVVVE